jgi:hypothetical protein
MTRRAAIAMLVGAWSIGCSSGPQPATGLEPGEAAVEHTTTVVFLDGDLTGDLRVVQEKTDRTPEGNLSVLVEFENLSSDDLQLLVSTVFRGEGNTPTEAETPWAHVRIPAKATHAYRTRALNEKAQRYTVRVREGS